MLFDGNEWKWDDVEWRWVTSGYTVLVDDHEEEESLSGRNGEEIFEAYCERHKLPIYPIHHFSMYDFREPKYTQGRAPFTPLLRDEVRIILSAYPKSKLVIVEIESYPHTSLRGHIDVIDYHEKIMMELGIMRRSLAETVDFVSFRRKEVYEIKYWKLSEGKRPQPSPAQKLEFRKLRQAGWRAFLVHVIGNNHLRFYEWFEKYSPEEIEELGNQTKEDKFGPLLFP